MSDLGTAGKDSSKNEAEKLVDDVAKTVSNVAEGVGETVSDVADTVLKVPEDIVKEIAPEAKNLTELGKGTKGDENIARFFVGAGLIYAVYNFVKGQNVVPIGPVNPPTPVGPSPTPATIKTDCEKAISYW